MSCWPTAPSPLVCKRCLAPAQSPAEIDAALRGKNCPVCEEDESVHQESGLWTLKTLPPPP